ncbi:het domain-containing protein [Neofusicoccum parvum]|nr:het domain-containing protein [Neofusicoccum parvum]
MTPWWESQALDIAYSPLQDGAIRLIEFNDVDTTAAQHTSGFKIHHVLLEEAPPYCTLSYRWSSGKEDDEPTKTNGFWIDVRGGSLTAVRACLSQVKEKGIDLFWIDQFCINQSDLTEKSQQVSLMASIYSAASTTVIWLGHPRSPTGDDGHFQAAFSFLDEISRHWHRPDQYDSDSDNGEDAIKSQSTGVISALVATLSAPWFGRTWVLQEALLSRDPVVLCGSRSLSWRSLVLAVRQLAETTALQVWFRSFLDRGKWNFHLQNASLFCNLYLDPDEDGLQRPESALKCLMLLCRSREASDRRDKVFALKGLCTPEDAPVVDYSVPEAVVLRDLACRLLSEGHEHYMRVAGGGDCLFYYSALSVLAVVNADEEICGKKM